MTSIPEIQVFPLFADGPDQRIGELFSLMHAVSEQRLIVQAALEEDMDVAFPREADTAV